MSLSRELSHLLLPNPKLQGCALDKMQTELGLFLYQAGRDPGRSGPSPLVDPRVGLPLAATVPRSLAALSEFSAAPRNRDLGKDAEVTSAATVGQSPQL